MSQIDGARIHELEAAKAIFTADLEGTTKRDTELKATIKSTETTGDVLREQASIGDDIKKLTVKLVTLDREIEKSKQIETAE